MNGGGGWGIFNAILGWQNSATYGSVISYNVYWIVVIAGFFLMRYREVKGHLPLLKPMYANGRKIDGDLSPNQSMTSSGVVDSEKKVNSAQTVPVHTVSA